MGSEIETNSKAIIGKTGVFYIFVTDRRKASSIDNYINYVNSINSSRSSALRNKAYNALKEKAKIEDFRSNFY